MLYFLSILAFLKITFSTLWRNKQQLFNLFYSFLLILLHCGIEEDVKRKYCEKFLLWFWSAEQNIYFCKIEHEPLILLTFEEVIGFLRISAVNMKLKSNFHLWIEYKETSDSWNICLSFTFWAWMKWTEYCLTNTFLRFCAIHSSFCTSTSNFNCWNWNNCDTIHLTKDQMLFCTISE